MKSLLVALSVAVAATTAGLVPLEAQAKRLGGGKAVGMQRQAPAPAQTPPTTPPQTAPQAAPGVPAQAAAPAAAGTAAAAAAAAPKRNWLGPVAGLAAGLGLAALFSHLGWGEGLANFVMLALLAVAAVVLVRFLMARFAGGKRPAASVGGPQLAGAGVGPMGSMGTSGTGWQAPAASTPARPEPVQPLAMPRERADMAPALAGTGLGTAGTGAAVMPALPGGMAQADFERLAKLVFIRMQAANDAGNLDDLRKFTTPELFAALRLDLQERGGVTQQTDVVEIEAQVVEVAQHDGQDIVSVRYRGLIRESADAPAAPFHELWHLVRPSSGQGDWAIAGITPVEATH